MKSFLLGLDFVVLQNAKVRQSEDLGPADDIRIKPTFAQRISLMKIAIYISSCHVRQPANKAMVCLFGMLFCNPG